MTVVLCPNCVNGLCNMDNAEIVTDNLQNASCICDRGWTGNTDLCTSYHYGRLQVNMFNVHLVF